jgi:hypothetical protein
LRRFTKGEARLCLPFLLEFLPVELLKLVADTINSTVAARQRTDSALQKVFCLKPTKKKFKAHTPKPRCVLLLLSNFNQR